MSTLTTLSPPALLEVLLAEGRRKLAARRRAWEEEEELLMQREESRRLDHWQSLRTRVSNDLGDTANALTVQLDVPDDFSADAPLAQIEVTAPGLAPIAMLYGFGGFWERHPWDVTSGRFTYAVPTYYRRGDKVERNPLRDWHHVNDLAEALALAEEVEQQLARLRFAAAEAEAIPF